jgi:hypothetical protein
MGLWGHFVRLPFVKHDTQHNDLLLGLFLAQLAVVVDKSRRSLFRSPLQQAPFGQTDRLQTEHAEAME